MGLEGWLVWLGWFLHSFLIIIIVSTIMTLLMKLQLSSLDNGEGFITPILAYSDPFLIWVLLVVYGVSSIVFCFAIATFFNRREYRDRLSATACFLFICLTHWSWLISQGINKLSGSQCDGHSSFLQGYIPQEVTGVSLRYISAFHGIVTSRSPVRQWRNFSQTGSISRQVLYSSEIQVCG